MFCTNNIDDDCVQKYRCPLLMLSCAIALAASCALQQYDATEVLMKINIDKCKTKVKDVTGAWICADHAYSACDAGFTNTLDGQCAQQCPSWMVNCNGACHTPTTPCGRVQPAVLCGDVAGELKHAVPAAILLSCCYGLGKPGQP